MPGKGPTIAASNTLPPDSSTADKSRRVDGDGVDVAKVVATRQFKKKVKVNFIWKSSAPFLKQVIK